MFAYNYDHGGTMILVVVAGGKQVRASGATVGATIRGRDYFIGEIDKVYFGRLEKAYGKVIGV